MRLLKKPLTGIFINNVFKGITSGYNFYIDESECKHDKYRKTSCFSFKIKELDKLEIFKRQRDLFSIIDIIDLPFKRILYKPTKKEFSDSQRFFIEESLKGLFFNLYINDVKNLKDLFTEKTFVIRNKPVIYSNKSYYEELFLLRIGPTQKNFNKHTGPKLYKDLKSDADYKHRFNLTIENETLWISK